MNRVALVTGASRGIGRAIAAELAEAGHAVCINYLTHRQEAETLAEKIRNHGGNAIAVQADVADRAAVETMVRTAEAELGREPAGEQRRHRHSALRLRRCPVL